MTPVLDALFKNKQEEKPCVVATIVQVEGPAYQREGARCVIQENGEIVGMLSGGCVEAELKKQACEVFKYGRSKLIPMDFSSEEDLLFGFGSVCGGKLLIWLEPVNLPHDVVISLSLMDELRYRETALSPYFSFTIVESGNPAVYSVGQRWRETSEQCPYQPENGRAGLIKTIRDEVELVLFVEYVQPRPHLIIIGTGEDAVLLSRMAKQLNWHVQLVFHKTERATEACFPDVDEIIHIPRCEFSRLFLTPHHYVVVMSHHFEIDLEAVKQLLPTLIPYIGLLGSRTRIQRVLDSLTNVGTVDEKHNLNKLHAPVGLDLGAKTPEEITLSIITELVAFHNKATGGFLRERKGWLSARR